MFILTSEHNDYDQHGEYFIAAYYHRPSVVQLAKALEKDGYPSHLSEQRAEYLLETGGGRKGVEGVWYNLFRYEDTDT